MKNPTMTLTAALCATFLALGAGAQETRGAGDRALDTAEDKTERAAGETEGAGDRLLEKISRKNKKAKPAKKMEGAGDRAVENIGNASLTGRVKSALAAQPETSAFRTEVDSDRGSVTLKGEARSNAERELAEKVVKGVKGVKDVDNQIEVR